MSFGGLVPFMMMAKLDSVLRGVLIMQGGEVAGMVTEGGNDAALEHWGLSEKTIERHR